METQTEKVHLACEFFTCLKFHCHTIMPTQNISKHNTNNNNMIMEIILLTMLQHQIFLVYERIF